MLLLPGGFDLNWISYLIGFFYSVTVVNTHFQNFFINIIVILIPKVSGFNFIGVQFHTYCKLLCSDSRMHEEVKFLGFA